LTLSPKQWDFRQIKESLSMTRMLLLAGVLAILCAAASRADEDKAGPNDNQPPSGFKALFNGKDLTGWQGLVTIKDRQKMNPEQQAAAQKKANEVVLPHWSVRDGIIHYDGKGPAYKSNLQTIKDYGNFELWVDWKIPPKGDSGIYLRGNPQVQIWDRPDLGSGGLYNNEHHPKNPTKVTDRPTGQWNRFHIIMKGDQVTVYLNDQRVVDQVPLENYWERGKPLPARGPIELQDHKDPLQFKNIYIKELPD
jgi:hypothetical protein